MRTTGLVFLYLGILMLANILVWLFGQPVLVITASLLVPFDFAIRTVLQERWDDSYLWIRLFSLMVVGGLLTVLVFPAAHHVAMASVTAFIASSLAGAVMYRLIWSRDRQWSARAGSLAVMASMDSIVFPLLAFDHVTILLMIFQASIKWVVSFAVILGCVPTDRKGIEDNDNLHSTNPVLRRPSRHGA